jgi:hypothetical protein
MPAFSLPLNKTNININKNRGRIIVNDKMIDLAVSILKEAFNETREYDEPYFLRMLEYFQDLGLFSDVYVVASELKRQKAELMLTYFKFYDHLNAERVKALM